jgi:hypothetical protein
MTRLRLIIADTDETYVESLVGYFMLNYSQKFQVSSFTNKEYLIEYLSDENNKIDILLIESNLFSNEIPKENIATIIQLIEERTGSESNGCSTICKYQQGDKIVSDIFNIYAQKENEEVIDCSFSYGHGRWIFRLSKFICRNKGSLRPDENCARKRTCRFPELQEKCRLQGQNECRAGQSYCRA